MQILSAADSISPALARTLQVLFSPFRLGRTWKLGITGYLAFASTVFLPFPLFYLSFATQMLRQGHRSIATVALIFILIAFALFAWFFYLFSRLQFAFFDIVLNRGQFVAPAWRKYGPQTWPWMGAKIVFGTVFMLITVLPFVPLMLHSFHALNALQAMSMTPGQPPPPGFIGAILSFELLIFSVFGTLFVFDSLLTDFVLPSLALEATTLRESFRRFGQLVRREPGQMFIYLILKTALSVAGYIAMVMAYFAVIVIYLIVIALVLGIGYLLLHALHVSSGVLVVLALTIGVPTYIFVVFYSSTLGAGIVLTFLQAYALYFLGGRYPLLGTMLDSSTPPPPGMAPPPSQHVYADDPPNPYAYLNLPPTPPTV